MRRHTGHCCWHFPGGPAYTSVIEQNHFSRRCERIRHRRIPVLEGAHEVLQAQQGPTWSAAEASVGICVVLHLEQLRRGADVAKCRNGWHVSLRGVSTQSILRLCSIAKHWSQMYTSYAASLFD